MKTRIMLFIAITLAAWQVAAEVRYIVCSKSIGPEKYGQETGQSFRAKRRIQSIFLRCNDGMGG